MIDVSELIGDPDMGGLTTLLRTVTRARVTAGPGAGEVQTVSVDTPLTCNIQPATDWQRLNLLPEGLREDDAIRIWSPDELPEGSFVQWRGGWYKVAGKKRWMDGGYCQQLATQNNDAAGAV